MNGDPDKPASEGRIARHVRVAGSVLREPKSIVTLVRAWFVKLWQAKGGGFYGLGYVAVLASLEFQTFTGDIAGSDSVTGFVAGQVLGYVLRVSIESFINVLLALIWPVNVIGWLGLWAIPVLGAGFLAFESVVRPIVESWFPEMRDARIERARRKQQKKSA
jgi:hypothetical protein